MHWTQRELDSLRTLLGEGKRVVDAIAALKKTQYSVNQVSRYDASRKGWWTPERPADIPEFRKQSRSRVDTEDAPNPESPSGPKRRAWTQADDDRALELWNSGIPLDDIATELGRSAGAVRTRLNRQRCGPEAKPFSAKEDAKILSLRDSSCTVEELRELMPHRSVEAIRSRAAHLGVVKHLKAEPWTHEEVVKLWQLRAKGLPFSQIALHLPERTTSACRFKHRTMPEHLRPTIEEINATPSGAVEEDK